MSHVVGSYATPAILPVSIASSRIALSLTFSRSASTLPLLRTIVKPGLVAGITERPKRSQERFSYGWPIGRRLRLPYSVTVDQPGVATHQLGRWCFTEKHMSDFDPLTQAEANAHLAGGLLACLDTMHELMAGADWARQKDDLGALIGAIRDHVSAIDRNLQALHGLRNGKVEAMR